MAMPLLVTQSVYKKCSVYYVSFRYHHMTTPPFVAMLESAKFQN